MESKPQLSSREKRILMIFTLVAFGVLGFYLLLGWMRKGGQVSTPDLLIAEIAVLVPLDGEEAGVGKEILDIVTKSKDYFVDELELTNWDITVKGYDTGASSNSAAWAAFKAARNPNTIAIIGPINARQVVAVENTVFGKKIAILTPASTASTLNVSSEDGVYRIPASDDLQGPAIVDFLESKRYENVYLIVESNGYTEKILVSLTAAAENRIKFVGSNYLRDPDQIVEIVNELEDRKTEAILYLGDGTGLSGLIQGISQTDIEIPIVGVDSINDPGLYQLLANGQELFFTSPIYSNQNILGPYFKIFANETVRPYHLESVQATWFILKALAANLDGSSRESVWGNLTDVSIQGLNGEKLELIDGQLTPPSIYVYEAQDQESNWFFKPIFVFRDR